MKQHQKKKDTLGPFRELAEKMQRLTAQAIGDYAPEVEAVIKEKSRDIKRIERLLDGLLDFAFNPDVLILYKKLCRYYYFIDPVATASYVNAYREMWDEENPPPPQKQ
jgi:hypothetical protein